MEADLAQKPAGHGDGAVKKGVLFGRGAVEVQLLRRRHREPVVKLRIKLRNADRRRQFAQGRFGLRNNHHGAPLIERPHAIDMAAIDLRQSEAHAFMQKRAQPLVQGDIACEFFELIRWNFQRIKLHAQMVGQGDQRPEADCMPPLG